MTRGAVSREHCLRDCPTSSGEAKLLEMSALALVRYLMLPLRGACGILIGVFTLLLLVAIQAKFLGIPLALILLSWFFKYAFVLLDHVADGAADPPVLSIEMVNPANEQRPLGLLLLVIAGYSASGSVGVWLGGTAMWVLRALGLTLLPAVVAVQATTGSVLASLNPLAWLDLMRRLGPYYGWILLCIAGFVALAKGVVTQWLGVLPLTACIALLLYGWLAVFAMVGGVLFEQRVELGFEARYAPERVQARHDAERDRERDRFMDGVFAEWRGGAVHNAWHTIERHLATSADTTIELEWLYERAKTWPDQRLASRLAMELVPRLLAARRLGRLLQLTQARIKADARFRPLTSAQLIKLVELARDAGDRPTARALLEEFDRHFPNDPARGSIEKLLQQLQR